MTAHQKKGARYTIESFVVTSLHRAEKFARGGLLSRPRGGTKTEYSSWERQQGFTIQSVPAPSTGFHGTVCPCCLSV